jgi:hypothetical protein
MAEDRFEPREIDFRQWLPWTHLFRGFWIALDHKKLLLAAAGILTMAIGWWVLAWLFYDLARGKKPDIASGKYSPADYLPKDETDPKAREQVAKARAWEAFTQDLKSWNLLHEAAGSEPDRTGPGDVAKDLDEFERINAKFEELPKEVRDGKHPISIELSGQTYVLNRLKPYGKLRTWPWLEDRGPNPFLLVVGKAGHQDLSGTAHYVPWERGGFIDWFFGNQVPVLLEPLVKFVRPVFYFLNQNASGVDRFYFFLVILWTVTTWAFFGGAITRIAAVEIARNEKIGLTEAVRYTAHRWRSYLFASFAPLLFIAVCVLFLALFGLVNLIPFVAEFWNGLLWWLALGIGLFTAVLLVGLVGWPLIHATLSAEGSDSFDAISRSLSYVLQKPWSYLWYAVVALAYGAVIVFFVGLMGSLMVYLSKWGVNRAFIQNTRFDRSYMFIYAPTSYGWRDLLLHGTTVVPFGESGPDANPVAVQQAIDNYATQLKPWNYIGAVLVAFWLYLVFLLMIGFGYSYFWSASTMIYLLMRRKVDDTELDEVYLEEDDSEEPYSAPVTAATQAPSSTASAPGAMAMVEPPTLRTAAPSVPVSTAPVATASEVGTPKPPDSSASPAGEPAT